jgi:hypothetical protein
VSDQREQFINDFLVDVNQAIITLAQELTKHPTDCVIWLLGPGSCDCGRGSAAIKAPTTDER